MTLNQIDVFGTILYSPQGRFLAVRGAKSQKWSFPKGHPEGNETELECALRETREETGLTLPSNYHSQITLGTGRYFVYYVDSEPQTTIQDTQEVQSTAWLTAGQLNRAQHNVDVSWFLRYHAKKVRGTTPNNPTLLTA